MRVPCKTTILVAYTIHAHEDGCRIWLSIRIKADTHAIAPNVIGLSLIARVYVDGPMILHSLPHPILIRRRSLRTTKSAKWGVDGQSARCVETNNMAVQL